MDKLSDTKGSKVQETLAVEDSVGDGACVDKKSDAKQEGTSEKDEEDGDSDADDVEDDESDSSDSNRCLYKPIVGSSKRRPAFDHSDEEDLKRPRPSYEAYVDEEYDDDSEQELEDDESDTSDSKYCVYEQIVRSSKRRPSFDDSDEEDLRRLRHSYEALRTTKSLSGSLDLKDLGEIFMSFRHPEQHVLFPIPRRPPPLLQLRHF
jgi:hypothetical protein